MIINRQLAFALLALLFGGLFGCASGTVTIEDVDQPINEIHRFVVAALPIKMRTESASGREFNSGYFVPRKGDFEEVDGGPIRYYAHIEILGDQKPYTIEVTVPLERRTSEGHYSLDKNDEGIARVITRRIQKGLHDRREDRNVIDDFRVF